MGVDERADLQGFRCRPVQLAQRHQGGRGKVGGRGEVGLSPRLPRLLAGRRPQLLLQLVPQPEVVPPVGVDDVLEVVGRVEELAVGPPTRALLHVVVARHNAVAATGRGESGFSHNLKKRSNQSRLALRISSSDITIICSSVPSVPKRDIVIPIKRILNASILIKVNLELC